MNINRIIYSMRLNNVVLTDYLLDYMCLHCIPTLCNVSPRITKLIGISNMKK